MSWENAVDRINEVKLGGNFNHLACKECGSTLVPCNCKELSIESALASQIGGGHYKSMTIQPVEFIQKNNLNYCEANVIKYVCRHAKKNGIEDLKKANHYLQLLIEMEYPDG